MHELFEYAAQYDIAETQTYSPMHGVVSLYQNYPNPFNSTTIIRFNINRWCHVTLNVYNVVGQEVATLVDKELQTGEHRVDFDAQCLPSGVYYLRFVVSSVGAAGSRGKAEDYTETRKLLLIK